MSWFASSITKHPVLWGLVGAVLGMLGTLGAAYFGAKPSFQQQTLDMNSQILDASGEVVRIQAQLQALRESSNEEVAPMFQSMVDLFDHYDTEAWVKVKEPLTGRWPFVAINSTYSRRYGVSFQALNKTIEELYEVRHLSDENQLKILKYEVNDETAAGLRPGAQCYVFTEWATPLDGEEGMYRFVKCPVVHRSLVYVVGHREIVN